MSAYEKFAQVYDLFMDNIDYEGWAEYVTDRLREYEITDGLVLPQDMADMLASWL